MSDVQQSTARPSPVPAALEAHRAAKERRARFAAAVERPKIIAAEIIAEVARAVPAPPAGPLTPLDRVELAMNALAARREEILRGAVAPIKPRPYPSVADIQAIVASFYGVTVLDIVSARRTKKVVGPRHVAIYLARTMTVLSLPDIGRRFGDRDHTVMLYAFHKISELIARDVVAFAEVETLRTSIEALP